ncbi:hypothetical protein AB0K12_00180 [Nonomuraea sp. NPDC049419]
MADEPATIASGGEPWPEFVPPGRAYLAASRRLDLVRLATLTL